MDDNLVAKTHPDSNRKKKKVKDIVKELADEVKELEPDNKFVSTENRGSVLVIILICESKACDSNISDLKWVFSDPYFTVQICSVDPPTTINDFGKKLTAKDYIENYFMRKALIYASEGPYILEANGVNKPQYQWKDLPCIIIKDSSVSNIAPSSNSEIAGGMKKRIQISLEKATTADLFYLCKWSDACDKYTEVAGITGSIEHGSTLKWSVQPTATQAIMYTPKSRDYVKNSLNELSLPLGIFLNQEIAQGKLLATVFVPNLIDFDVNLATNNQEYAMKLAECAPPSTGTGTSSSAAAIVWIILIVLVLIICIAALIQVTPNIDWKNFLIMNSSPK